MTRRRKPGHPKKRKVEDWVRDLYPRDGMAEAYSHLPPRELALVAAASLDAALVQILERSLHGPRSSVEGLLGIGANGPCKSFAARIQLAVAVEAIPPGLGLWLDGIRDVRNPFAHRAQVTFTDDDVRKSLRRLLTSMCGPGGGVALTNRKAWDDLCERAETDAKVGQKLFEFAFVTIQQWAMKFYESLPPSHFAGEEPNAEQDRQRS